MSIQKSSGAVQDVLQQLVRRKVLFAAAIGTVVSMVVACNVRDDGNYAALSNLKLVCPTGSHVEYLPWSESGLRAVCLMEHGPIAMAEQGKVRVQGEYRLGKKVGKWVWQDADGRVSKEEELGTAMPTTK